MIIKSAILASIILSLYGCTVNLPAKSTPIPAADPILVPAKSEANSTNQSKTAVDNKSTPQTTGTPSEQTQSGNSTAVKINDNQGQLFYLVKPKDTVFEVMRKTGVDWTRIIELNNLKAPDYRIFPGQSLRIK